MENDRYAWTMAAVDQPFRKTVLLVPLQRKRSLFAIVFIVLANLGCSSSGSITNLFGPSNADSVITDVSGSTVTASVTSIPVTGSFQISVCPRSALGSTPSLASGLIPAVTFSGGSSSLTIGNFVFDSATSCFVGTATGVAAGTPSDLTATLSGPALTASVSILGGSVRVTVPRLGLSGNSLLSTAVASRIVTDVMGSWTFSGNCDPALGSVVIQGEAIDTPTTTTCASNGTFSLAVNYTGASPYFVTGYSSCCGLPEVIIKQGSIQTMTRIYKIPVATTILYVADAAALQGISINGSAADANRAIILTSDIDLSTVSATNNFTRLAPGSTGANRFYSTVYGDGHTISNLNMTSASATYTSIFGYVSAGLFTDLHFTNVSIVSNQNEVGVLAGRFRTASMLRISASGSVSTSGNSVGGIAGYVWGSQISESWFSGSVSGALRVGGIAGYLWDQYITDSWSAGSVVGTGVTGQVGGVLGYLDVGSLGGYVANTYSTATVSAQDSAGGIIGKINEGGVVSNSRDSFATGNIQMTAGAPTGNEYVGPAVGINGQYLGAYFPNTFTTISNMFSLDTATCSICHATSIANSSTKSWVGLNTYVQSQWNFVNKWKNAADSSVGPPTLLYNP